MQELTMDDIRRFDLSPSEVIGLGKLEFQIDKLTRKTRIVVDILMLRSLLEQLELALESSSHRDTDHTQTTTTH